MASLLLLEDGTGVAGANSYVDAAAARDYASERGITLPAVPESGPDPVEVFLVLASDYLESQSWIGVQATTTQGLMWPRVLTYPYRGYPYYPGGAWYYGIVFDPSYYVVPDKLKSAQCQLVIEQNNGVVLLPTTLGGTQFIVREKVDVIETQYSEKLGTLATPTMLTVNSLLQGLLIRGGGAGAISTVRV